MNEENLNLSYEQKDIPEQETTPVREKENASNEECVFKSVVPTKEQIEKEEIKKKAVLIGISFTLLIVLANLLTIILIFSLKFSGLDTAQMQNFLDEPGISQVQQILFSLIVFSVPFLSVFKLAKYRISDLISFKQPEKETIVPFLLFGVAFCSFSNIASSFISSLFDSFGVNYDIGQDNYPSGIFGFLLMAISSVAVPALIEEFVCRGIVLGALRKFGDVFAIIVSAAVFGIMHANFEQMPFAFLMGLVLGFVTVKSGSILPAIVIHGFNNSISLTYAYILDGLSLKAQNVSYTIFLIVCLLLGVLAFTMLKEKNEVFTFSCEGTKLRLGEKFKIFFTSIPVIIFIVLCLISSLEYFV